MRLSSLLLLLVLSSKALAHGPRVTLPFGTFEGLSNSSTGVDTFLGLPFTAPPIGDLRLRHPAPISVNYGAVVQNATVQKDDCMQAPSNLNPIPENLLPTFANISAETSSWPGVAQTASYSEDCLYLNVIRPSTSSTSKRSDGEGKGYPVLFWIYGGGGINGGISAYVEAGQNLVRASIQNGQPIIFVAVNYRMSIWGFLPGREVVEAGVSNLGVLDQRAGMDWVQKYIREFGGDPDNVTISGGSAGSICTFFHLLLYGGQNPPFHRAILESGSIVPMAPQPAAFPQSQFDLFASLVGCGESSDKVSCIRSAPLELLADSVGNTTFWWTIKNLVLYAPQVDGWTLPDTPQNLLREGRFARVPVIMGDVQDEGAGFEVFWANVTDEAGFEGWVGSMAEGLTRETMAEIIEAYPQDPAKGSPFGTGDLYQLTPESKRINALFGDYLFAAARRYVLSHLTRLCIPAWSYLYSHSASQPWYGASHGTDIASFFGLLPDRIAQHVQGSYISFIATGDPNNWGGREGSGLPYWPGYGEGGKRGQMNFGVNGTNDSVVMLDNYREWGMQIYADAIDQFRY